MLFTFVGAMLGLFISHLLFKQQKKKDVYMLDEQNSTELHTEAAQVVWRHFLQKIYMRWAWWFAVEVGLLTLALILLGSKLEYGLKGLENKSAMISGALVFFGSSLVLVFCNWVFLVYRGKDVMPPAWVSYIHYAAGFAFWPILYAKNFISVIAGFPLFAAVVGYLRWADIDPSSAAFRQALIRTGIWGVPVIALALAFTTPILVAMALILGLCQALYLLFSAVLSTDIFRAEFERDMREGRSDRALLLEGYMGFGRFFRLGLRRALCLTFFGIYNVLMGIGLLILVIKHIK